MCGGVCSVLTPDWRMRGGICSILTADWAVQTALEPAWKQKQRAAVNAKSVEERKVGIHTQREVYTKGGIHEGILTMLGLWLWTPPLSPKSVRCSMFRSNTLVRPFDQGIRSPVRRRLRCNLQYNSL
eukprot:673834-Pyramimonas_sp.AAC.1